MKTIKLFLITILISVSSLLNAQCKKDTVFYYEFESGTNIKKLTDRDIHQYNSSGLVSDITYQIPSSTPGLWENQIKLIFTYDSYNNKTVQLTQNWEVTNKIWVNQNKSEYAYDAKNNLIEETIFGWNAVDSKWANGYKRSLTLDNKYKVTKELFQIWDDVNLAWNNYTQSASTFDSEQKLIEVLTVIWDADNSQWNNLFSSIIKYNIENNIAEEILQSWDTEIKEWRNDSKTTYNYDGKKLSEKLVSLSNLKGNDWIENTKETYEYSKNDDLIAIDRYANWDEINKDYANHYRQEIVCKNTTGSNADLDISINNIYPNPIVNNAFFIDSKIKTSYKILDYLGKEITNGNLEIGVNCIKTNSLAKGIYYVFVNNQITKLINP